MTDRTAEILTMLDELLADVPAEDAAAVLHLRRFVLRRRRLVEHVRNLPWHPGDLIPGTPDAAPAPGESDRDEVLRRCVAAGEGNTRACERIAAALEHRNRIDNLRRRLGDPETARRVTRSIEDICVCGGSLRHAEHAEGCPVGLAEAATPRADLRGATSHPAAPDPWTATPEPAEGGQTDTVPAMNVPAAPDDPETR